MKWTTVLLTASLGVGAAAALAVVHGHRRWQSLTDDIRARLDRSRQPIQPSAYDPRELEGLPAAVRRYFQTVLPPGQPMVVAARVTHEGTFNLAERGERWAPFTSTQVVITGRRPGFDWDARVRMAPGVTAYVHDAYVEGEGILHGALWALVPVVNLRGTPEVAEGELMRFLAEAPWYPTMLLPSQGVRWEPIDDGSARASLTDGRTMVTLEVTFDDEGLIAAMRAALRYRTKGRASVPTPWEGRLWGYQWRHGMRVPLEGEVAWLPPEGRAPYWRGTITSLEYEFARGDQTGPRKRGGVEQGVGVMSAHPEEEGDTRSPCR